MMNIVLSNYVPDTTEACGWIFTFEEGNFFEATSISRDGKIRCDYRLDNRAETLIIRKKVLDYHYNEYDQIVEKKITPISQNDGTGNLVLSTNREIEKRFGHFRRKKFQDFMDEFNITSIKHVSYFGYDATHLIHNADKSDRSIVYLPSGSSIRSVTGTKVLSYNTTAKLVPVPDSFAVIRVVHAPYWVYHQEKDGVVNRILFVNSKSVKNVMDLRESLTELLK